jgi:hypothetical protein
MGQVGYCNAAKVTSKQSFNIYITLVEVQGFPLPGTKDPLHIWLSDGYCISEQLPKEVYALGDKHI